MWMTYYIQAVKREFENTYHFIPTGGTPSEPTFDNIPDGEYPMIINGRTDNVRVADNKLYVCNFPYEELKFELEENNINIKVVIETAKKLKYPYHVFVSDKTKINVEVKDAMEAYKFGEVSYEIMQNLKS